MKADSKNSGLMPATPAEGVQAGAGTRTPTCTWVEIKMQTEVGRRVVIINFYGFDEEVEDVVLLTTARAEERGGFYVRPAHGLAKLINEKFDFFKLYNNIEEGDILRFEHDSSGERIYAYLELDVFLDFLKSILS